MGVFVVSVVADERPGVVAELAGAVAQHGGNWLGSQMGRLGGKFAGAVLIEAQPERLDDLTAALQGLSDVAVVDVSTTVETAEGSSAGTVRLEVVGHDQPGIVRDVTGALAGHGMSIQELHTSVSDAPMTGDRLFQAVAVVSVSSGPDLAGIRSVLEQLSDELKVEIQVDDGRDGAAWGETPDPA